MASKISITEQGGAGRTLELYGPGLPRRGVAFPVVQRVVTDPVNGNADDSIQQTLGPYDDESSWEGFWRTTQLAAKPALFYPQGAQKSAPQKIALADSLAFLVDDITRAGHLLAVSWSVGDRKVERIGRIARFEPKYDRPDDVGWSIDWQWVGRGPARQSTTSFRSDQKAALAKSVSLQLGKLTAEIEAAKIVSANANLPQSASSFSLGALESFLDAPKKLLTAFGNVVRQVAARVDDLGKLIEKAEELPVDLATQAVDLATTCVETCASFEMNVSQKGPEAYVAFDQSSNVASLLEAASYFGSAQDEAHTAMQFATEMREAAKKAARPSAGGEGGSQSATPDLLTVVIAKTTDTFAGLASRFYSNPDLGSAIAKANNYPAYAVKPTAGALLVIPNAAAAQANA